MNPLVKLWRALLPANEDARALLDAREPRTPKAAKARKRKRKMVEASRRRNRRKR